MASSIVQHDCLSLTQCAQHTQLPASASRTGCHVLAVSGRLCNQYRPNLGLVRERVQGQMSASVEIHLPLFKSVALTYNFHWTMSCKCLILCQEFINPLHQTQANQSMHIHTLHFTTCHHHICDDKSSHKQATNNTNCICPKSRRISTAAECPDKHRNIPHSGPPPQQTEVNHCHPLPGLHTCQTLDL